MAWEQDWANVNKLWLMRPFAREISEAIKERYELVNGNVWPGGPADPLWTQGGTYYSDVQMDLLITQFVNHTVAAGDYSGQSAIPMWNEADLLAHIGASQRLRLPNALEFGILDWMKQQQLLLDNMRWTRLSQNGFDFSGASWEQRDSFGATYAAAVSDWNTRSWSSTSNNVAAHSSSFAYSAYRIRRRRIVNGLLGLNLPTQVTRNHTLDIYAAFAASNEYHPGTYENHDYAGAPNAGQLDRLAQTSIPSPDHSATVSVGDFPTVTASEPAVNAEVGWRVSSYQIVLKWDVPGGLTRVS